MRASLQLVKNGLVLRAQAHGPLVNRMVSMHMHCAIIYLQSACRLRMRDRVHTVTKPRILKCTGAGPICWSSPAASAEHGIGSAGPHAEAEHVS